MLLLQFKLNSLVKGFGSITEDRLILVVAAAGHQGVDFGAWHREPAGRAGKVSRDGICGFLGIVKGLDTDFLAI